MYGDKALQHGNTLHYPTDFQKHLDLKAILLKALYLSLDLTWTLIKKIKLNNSHLINT